MKDRSPSGERRKLPPLFAYPMVVLPPDVAAALEREARDRGEDPTDLAVDLIALALDEMAGEVPAEELAAFECPTVPWLGEKP